MLLRFAGPVLVAALCGCSPVTALNALVPASGFVKSADLRYGELPQQGLDVYVPAQVTKSKRPVIVFLYGGSWQTGRRQEFLFVGEALTSLGYVAVIPDYRVYPEGSPSRIRAGRRRRSAMDDRQPRPVQWRSSSHRVDGPFRRRAHCGRACVQCAFPLRRATRKGCWIRDSRSAIPRFSPRVFVRQVPRSR